MTDTPDLTALMANLGPALGALAANAAHIAHARASLYNAHIAEGFTPEQALVLCQRLTFG